jgi:cellulose synthase/poly-beta-1,6-N-acetylglucosamine synthase-like glycosyltransferase
VTGIPTVSLELETGPGDPVNPLAAQSLPERVCRHFRMLPVSYDGETLVLAMSDPEDTLAQSVAFALTTGPLEAVLAPPSQIDRAIDRVFGGLGHANGTEGEGEGAIAPAEEVSGVLAAPGRIGEILIDRGLIVEAQLAAALETQERAGNRIGEILYHEGQIGEGALAAALADQLRFPLVDLTGINPTAEALEVVPETLQREGRCLPLEVDEDTLYLAIADPLDDTTYAAIRDLTDLRVRTYMVTRSALDELLRRIHRGDHVRVARSELLARFPEESANRVLSDSQRISLVAVVAAAVAVLALAPAVGASALMVAFLGAYVLSSGYRVALTRRPRDGAGQLSFDSAQVSDLDERDLPTYSILVPLFGEANGIDRLAESLRRIDYPKAKLEILLLCEEEDEATIRAVRAADLPPHFELLLVPDSDPKTKPKACNYGLHQARGRYVVVFDAEDRPDPDQLKKAVLGWEQAGPEVVCIQCKLNYFNADQNLLTRLFAAEYAFWFELVLPSLGAAGAPIPLGGTSNHFERTRLIELGAWDPFNVTEDADLGIRLHKAGLRTSMLESDTLEEANSRMGNWIRQRSRWIKGYLQTYLVHMRHPMQLRQQIGARSWWSFQLIVGGTLTLVLNPILWVVVAVGVVERLTSLDELIPDLVLYAAAAQLALGGLAFTFLAIAGSLRRGLRRLVPYALLAPLYWALMSVGAWLGFYQLFTRPFHWEKTEHGLDRDG